MSQAGGRPSWPSNDDFLVFSLAVIFIGTMFFGWFFWTCHHTEMATAAVQVIHLQAVLLSHVDNRFAGADAVLMAQPPDTFTLEQLGRAFAILGAMLRPYVIPSMLVLGVLCYLRAAPGRYTRALDLEALIREQVKTFRYNAAFVSRPLKLVKLVPDQLRPSDPALHGHEWVARFAAGEDGLFEERRARRALAAQLGTPWQGVDAAPPVVRLLLAIFALHLTQKRDLARALLGEFSASLPPGGRQDRAGGDSLLPVSGRLLRQADKVLQSDAINASIERIAGRHAYTVNVLMSVLTEARLKAGVLAPGQFVCLKLVDRNLWYALHSLGFEGEGPGQTTHPNPRIEAAGARDHWQMERMTGRPIVRPSVDRAIAAIRANLGQAEGVPGARAGNGKASEAA